MSWQRGRHSINIGGGYLYSSAWENAQVTVPQVNLGMSGATCGGNPCDPAFNLFTSTTIPGVSTGGRISGSRAGSGETTRPEARRPHRPH